MKRIFFISVLLLLMALPSRAKTAVFDFSTRASLMEMGYSSVDLSSLQNSSYDRFSYTNGPIEAEWTNTYIDRSLMLASTQAVNGATSNGFNFDTSLGAGKVKLTIPTNYKITRISVECLSEYQCDDVLFIVFNPDSDDFATGAGTNIGSNVMQYTPAFSGVREVTVCSSSSASDLSIKTLKVEYRRTDYLRSDFNDNGIVDIKDIRLFTTAYDTYGYAIGEVPSEVLDIYDVNEDGEIGPTDYNLVKADLIACVNARSSYFNQVADRTAMSANAKILIEGAGNLEYLELLFNIPNFDNYSKVNIATQKMSNNPFPILFDGFSLPLPNTFTDGKREIEISIPNEYVDPTKNLEILYVRGLDANGNYVPNGAGGFKVSFYHDPADEAIVFASAKTKTACVDRFDTNGDGKLSYREAAAVTITALAENKFQSLDIETFDEFKYFTQIMEIPRSTFAQCASLTSITLPDGLYRVGDNAFQGCGNLSQVNCANPSYGLLVGASAFYQCTKLTELPFGDHLYSIGKTAFAFSGITDVVLPASVQNVGELAFSQANNITSRVVIPHAINNPTYCSADGLNHDQEMGLHMPLIDYNNPNNRLVLNRANFSDAYHSIVDNCSEGSLSYMLPAADQLRPCIYEGQDYEGCFTTFCSPVAIALPSGMEVFVVDSFDTDTREFTAKSIGNVVPAGVPVVLKDSEPLAGRFIELDTSDSEGTTIEPNLLQPIWPYFDYTLMEVMEFTSTDDNCGWTFSVTPTNPTGGTAYITIDRNLLGFAEWEGIPWGETYWTRFEQSYKKGDVNGDGEVSIADMTALSNLLLDETSNERSDVNDDHETSIADITTLVNILLEQE